MRRLRFLPLLALCGCQHLPAGLGGGPTCDKAKLEALASELDGLSAQDATGRVWPGVKEACGDSLTNAATHLYDGDAFDREKAINFKPDAQYDRMVEVACPGWKDEVWEKIGAAPAHERALTGYRSCNFARFDLLPEERFEDSGGIGIVTWSMHAWFLDQGLDPEAARTISRALFALEERVALLGMVPKGVEPPVARGELIDSGTEIVLARDGVIFMDRKLAVITDGQIDPKALENPQESSLYEELMMEWDKGTMMAESTGREWDSRLLVIADQSTRAEALTQIMDVGSEAEWAHFSLVVASEEGLDLTQIPIEPPPEDASKLGEFLSVEVDARGYSLGRGRGAEPTERVSGHDFGRLTAQAEELKGEQPDATLVISASADTRLDRLVAAVGAGRRQLPRVVITSGGAHQLGLPPKQEGEDTPDAEVTVKGKLDKAEIRSTVRANIKDVRTCYTKGLTKDPELKGKVEINFVISHSGKVPTSVVQSSTLADAEVGKCIARAAKKWKFPAPDGGGNVVVTYPFKLSPS